jgi:hypothetical protein
LVKGPALAGPSERSERFEPLVRLGLPDTVAAATQKEKADTADVADVLSKLFVTVSGINLLPLKMPLTMELTGDAVLRLKPTRDEFPEAA